MEINFSPTETYFYIIETHFSPIETHFHPTEIQFHSTEANLLETVRDCNLNSVQGIKDTFETEHDGTSRI